MRAREFLETLFPDVPDGHAVLIWTLPDRVSRWFTELDQAARTCEQCSDGGSEVYVGVGLRSLEYATRAGARQRGSTEDVTGICGLWADVDVRNPVHAKPNLPPDEESAIALVESMGLPATMLVRSGHGVQAWWLFAEPWMFADSDAREKARHLCHGWQRTLTHRARGRGWAVDSVHDLARVLRVVGTTNHKGNPHAAVDVITANGSRYAHIEDFAARAIEPGSLTTSSSRVLIDVDYSATAPDKIYALIANHDKFRHAWEENRRDLDDQSPSGYEMALASIAAMANWSAEEIMSMLVQWRRIHGHPPKHEKALRLTVERAINQHESARNQARQEEVLEGVFSTVALSGTVDEAQRRQLLDQLSEWFGVRVIAWIQHGIDEAVYSVKLADGHEQRIGNANVVSSFRLFDSRLYAVTGRRLPLALSKPAKWKIVLEALGVIREVVVDEGEPEARIDEWVGSYLERHGAWDGDAWSCALLEDAPFIRDDWLWIHARSLFEHVQTTDFFESLPKLRFELRRAEYTRRTHCAVVDGVAITRSYWGCALERVAHRIRTRSGMVWTEREPGVFGWTDQPKDA